MLVSHVLSAFLIMTSGAAQNGGEQAPRTAVADKNAERRICKTSTETGSLARRKRVCMTAKEWDLLETQSKELGQSMQQLVSTERGG